MARLNLQKIQKEIVPVGFFNDVMTRKNMIHVELAQYEDRYDLNKTVIPC